MSEPWTGPGGGGEYFVFVADQRCVISYWLHWQEVAVTGTSSQAAANHFSVGHEILTQCMQSSLINTFKTTDDGNIQASLDFNYCLKSLFVDYCFKAIYNNN